MEREDRVRKHGYGTVKAGPSTRPPLGMVQVHTPELVRENRSVCACSDQLATLNPAVALQHVDILESEGLIGFSSGVCM